MLTAAICHPTVSDRYVIITLDARPRHMHTGYFLHFPPFYLEIGSVVLGCVCTLTVVEDLSLFPLLDPKVDQSQQLQSENSIVEITLCSLPMEFSVVFCFSLACLFCFSPWPGWGKCLLTAVAELCIRWPLSSPLVSISSPHKSHPKSFTQWDLRVTVFERMCLFSLYIEDCCIFCLSQVNSS